jgi:hypothetical protein
MAGAKAAGAKRALPLQVSIAAHSPLMDSIQADWNAAVDACAIDKPQIPVVGNVNAKPILTADELRADIKAQMQSRVRWTESVQLMQVNGIQAYVEAGNGEVLLGMIKRIDPNAVRFPLGHPNHFVVLKDQIGYTLLMTDFGTRLDRIVEEMTGNESLLQMLDTEAATEMLNWGIATAKAIVSKTQDLDDFAADLAITPRLKAVRQTMRSIGNWAAGNYADPESRIQLRDKLLQNFRVIFGEDSNLPSAERMDTVLNQVDDKTNTPNQLILKLRQVLEEAG